MGKKFHLLHNYIQNSGLSEETAKTVYLLGLLLIFVVVAFLIYYLVKRILIKVANKISKDLHTNIEKLMVSNKFITNASLIFPIFLAIEFIPYILVDHMHFEEHLLKGLYVSSIILILFIVRSIFNTFKDYLKTHPQLKNKPIDSYIQVFMITAWFIGIMLSFLIVTDKSLWQFFTTLGAVSALTLLIFKDTIMGFVASVQVTINDIVRIGDWVTFDNYGANGDVTEINLTTVKIKNFDETITTIPTYALISGSFKNWRGMKDSGGRRFKRSIYIKQSTIKFLNEEDLAKLERIELITDYIKSKQKEIEQFNTENNIDKSFLLNGKSMTNIGVFRKYLDNYIESHPAINKEMLFMIRQLEPTPRGLPIEIYAFSQDKRWKNYEFIVSDILDHVIATVNYFNLEIYERASDASKNNPIPRVTI